MALKLGSMWDFARPEVSEERFRAALDGASETRAKESARKREGL